MGLGALQANSFRLLLAALILGCWVGSQGRVDFSTSTVRWLLFSGVMGFGLGDVCLFLAFPRIGARLAMLVSLCGAPVFGALLDWCMQGTTFSHTQLLTSGLILLGVGMALLGGHTGAGQSDARWHPGSVPGVIAALGAGFGQGCGAALSRHAHALGLVEGVVLDGATQAFIRALPGMTFSFAIWLLASRVQTQVRSDGTAPRAWPWLAVAVIVGPVLGVSCFQWALSQQSSVVVLSITATAPVLVMPLAAWVDRDHPKPVAILGAVIAVAGVILMLRMGGR